MASPGQSNHDNSIAVQAMKSDDPQIRIAGAVLDLLDGTIGDVRHRVKSAAYAQPDAFLLNQELRRLESHLMARANRMRALCRVLMGIAGAGETPILERQLMKEFNRTFLRDVDGADADCPNELVEEMDDELNRKRFHGTHGPGNDRPKLPKRERQNG